MKGEINTYKMNDSFELTESLCVYSFKNSNEHYIFQSVGKGSSKRSETDYESLSSQSMIIVC